MTAADLEGKRQYALTVVVLLVIAAFAVPFHVRLIVDVFATGLSNAKIYAFPLFAGIAAFGYFLKPKDAAGFRQRAVRVGILLLVLFAASLAIFLYLTQTIGVSGLYRYYVVRDGFLSSNNLLHIHSLKPVVGWPLELFPEMSYTLDYGYPFMAYIPSYAYIPLSMLLLYLLYQMWKLAPYVGKRMNYSISWFFLACISVFTIVKNIVDGGFLCPQLTIPLGVFTYILLRRKEMPAWRKMLFLIASVLLVLALQVFIQLLVTAYLGGGISGEMALVLTALALTDENLPTTAALLLVIYLSFRLLNRKPTPSKLAAGIVIFAVLFNVLVWTSGLWEFNASPLSFSSALLESAHGIVPANTSFALITKSGSSEQQDFFAITNVEHLRRHDLVWGYTTKAVLGEELASVSGEPPGRRLQKIYCPYHSLSYNDTLLVKLYDYETPPERINSTLLSIEKSNRRRDEYIARMNYCTPSKLIVLMEALALYDNEYVLEPVVATPGDKKFPITG